MTNKTRFLYMKVLIMLKCNFKKLKKENLEIRVCHCDFEEALSSALLKCFPSSKIKFCFFHYGQILYRKITSTGADGLNISNDFNNSKEAKKLFLMLKYLCFVEPKYVKIIYTEILEKVHIEEFMLPFVEYFNMNFIEGRNIDTWNYCGMYTNRTNNCCEGYNTRLNGYFNSKPNIYKLLFKLKDEEELIYKNYIQSKYSFIHKYKKDDNHFVFINMMNIYNHIKNIFEVSGNDYNNLNDRELKIYANMYYLSLNDICEQLALDFDI